MSTIVHFNGSWVLSKQWKMKNGVNVIRNINVSSGKSTFRRNEFGTGISLELFYKYTHLPHILYIPIY